MILNGCLLLDHLGMSDAAKKISAAVDLVYTDGKVKNFLVFHLGSH
jgi:isocitrate/isopropylmalate dehydrogenase